MDSKSEGTGLPVLTGARDTPHGAPFYKATGAVYYIHNMPLPNKETLRCFNAAASVLISHKFDARRSMTPLRHEILGYFTMSWNWPSGASGLSSFIR